MGANQTHQGHYACPTHGFEDRGNTNKDDKEKKIKDCLLTNLFAGNG
jgi:hypothetical protein